MKKLFILFLLNIFLINKSFALIEIDITRGNLDPLPIAVSPLHVDSKSQKLNNVKVNDLGLKISQIIEKNFKSTGLFNPLKKEAFVQKPDIAHLKPRFEDWRLIKAQALVTGKLKVIDNKLKVEFRLWDLTASKEMIALAFTTTPSNWRRVAHIISDEIFERLSGDSGYFDTRIVYVSESGPQNKRIKRLAIMDQDGENHQFLTDGNFLVLTPRFSPTLQEITFLAYFKNEPRVYIFNLETGQQELLGSFPGMTFAPRFSPSGEKIIMSLAEKGVTDIYTMDLNNQEVNRLTNSPSIDTSPSFSPDGKQIIFNSDRGGSQQLYVMDSNGRNVKRISYGKGRYATPVWAPKGDLIAFTKMLKNKFYIGVISPDGSGERLLAEGYLVEGPTWAPNGRVLMYFKQNAPIDDGKSSNVNLYKIDITGFRETRLLTPSDGSDPAWSPLLTN